MKNKSIIKSFIDKFVNNEVNELHEYQKAKKNEIGDLKFIIREGRYYGYNIQDVLDIDPFYLLWVYREEVFKFTPFLIAKIYCEAVK